MNILYCDPQKTKSLQTSSTHIYGVLSALSQIGHNVIYINKDHPKNEVEINANPSSMPGRLKNNLMSWRILRLVGGEVAFAWFLARAIYVFLLAFIAIIRRRKINILYRRHTLINSEYLLARIFNIPLVKEVNGLVSDEIKVMGWGNRISLLVLNWIERFNMPKADKIIVVTSRLKEVLQNDYGVPGNKIVVIPNGANTDLFKPMDTTEVRDKLNLKQSSSYVCFIGNLWRAQSVDFLIRSMPLIVKELPDTSLLIVGDGIIKQELTSLAQQLGIFEKIIFTGTIPYHEVPKYINASDVCVVPAARNSRNIKTGASPLKLYEYIACGKPVVTGDVEGASQDVINSGSGLVVDPTNADEMAGAIVTLLKNEQLRKKMGERGRKVAAEKYSWRGIAEQVAEVCQSVIKPSNEC